MKRTILSALLAMLFCICLVLPFGVDAAGEQLVYDAAELLDAYEEEALELHLQDISQRCQAQILVCTVSSLNGYDVDSYVDVVYDSMGFGYGENRDGVLLLVCMDLRQYRILSNGYAGAAISNADIGDIGDAIVSDLSDGNYFDAFWTFADECDYYLDGYINGYPFPVGTCFVVSLVVGVVVALISLLVMRYKLKSVRRQNRAANYVRPGSMRVTLQRDIYLYRTVTRRKKESSSSSGSSGSGGSSRSRGGGSF